MNSPELEVDGRRLKPCTAISFRDVHGELIAIHQQTGEYHVFNGVGRLIWQEIKRGEATEAIIDAIVTQFAVTKDRAAADFRKFVGMLADRGILEECLDVKATGQ